MQNLDSISVCESLIAEHRQMEKLLLALAQALKAEDSGSVRQVLARIKPEMDLHFACEEQALFLAVSPYHSMDLMEAEHEELMALREVILSTAGLTTVNSAVLDESAWLTIKTTGHRFIEEMLDHIGREDAGIFPACERALTEAEKQTVLGKMASLRAAMKS
jgi:hemerythrin-like domain-containing protein